MKTLCLQALTLFACAVPLGCSDAFEMSETPAATAQSRGPQSSSATVVDAAATSPTNDGGDAAAECDRTTVDRLDDKGMDENCDGADGMVGVDVYVDAMQGDDTNAGNPDTPVQSVGAAIALAASRGGAVVVRAGTYLVSDIHETKGWAIYGGYPKGFVGVPTAALTELVVRTSEGWSITGAPEAALHHLTIRGMAAEQGGERTAYAVRSSIATIALDDVVLVAGNGTNGAEGPAGDPGSSEGVVDGKPGDNNWYKSEGGRPLVCAGVVQANWADGANGGERNPEGKPAGSPESAQPGADGSQGISGIDGNDASSAPLFADGFVRWGRGSEGTSDGQPGYGGAGGGDASLLCGSTSSSAYGGGGGTGGCPGGAGKGGESGGGSIGLLVMLGNATITRSQIRTGDGGDGGNGGLGGLGSEGGIGGEGTVVPACAAPDWSRGGAGGRGGSGGRGGGGAGGWSIGIITVGNATSTVDASTKFVLGRPGLGGKGNGGGRAPDGERHEVQHIDN